MASRRGRVAVSVTSDTSGLKRGVREAETSLGRLGKAGEGVNRAVATHSKRASGSLVGLAKAATGAAAAYAAITDAKAAVSTTTDLAKATLVLHRNLGLSVKTASEFAGVAKVRGIETKALSQTFGTLSKQLVNAEGGSKKALGAFRALGLSQRELKGLKFEDVLGLIADRFGQMHGGAERAALGMQLFGRGWQTVLPLMSQGNKGLQDQLALADKYGVTLGGKTVKSVKDLIAAQRESQFATLGLQVAFGTALAPALTKAINAVNRFIVGIRDGTGEGGRFANAMRPIISALGTVAKLFRDHPRLIAVAVGAWATYKAAGVAATAVTRARLLAQFTGLVPRAAAAGTASGAAFGGAATTAASGGMAKFGWKGLGTSIGSVIGKAMGIALLGWLGTELNLKFAGVVQNAIDKLPDGVKQYADAVFALSVPGGIKRAVGIAKAIGGFVSGGKKSPSGNSVGALVQGIQNSIHGNPIGSIITSAQHAVGTGSSAVKPIVVPKSSKAAGVNAGLVYPLATQGQIIGTPHTGTHTLGNWQSDNAVDIRVAKGTPVLAVEDGMIVKVSIRPQGGRISGDSITLKGKRNSYFYTHLSDVTVKAGQPVNAGDVIGYSGVANGVPHLHFGELHGNPTAFGKVKAGGVPGDLPLSPRQKVIERAARAAGIDPAVLYGVYGQESNFGKKLGPSSAGATGPFQIMPGTAKELGLSRADTMDFEKAAFAAARYLAKFKGRGTRGMLEAYNAGPAGNPNNPETRAYVQKVLGYARRFPTALGSGGLNIDPTDIPRLNQIIVGQLTAPIIRRLAGRQSPLNQVLRQGAAADETTDTSIATEQRLSDLPGGDKIGGLRKIGFLQSVKVWALQTRLPVFQGKINNYRQAIQALRQQRVGLPRAQKRLVDQKIKHYQRLIRTVKSDARKLGLTIQDAQIDVQATEATIADTLAAEEAAQPGINLTNVQRDLGLTDALESAGRLSSTDAVEGRKRIIGQALSGVYGPISLTDRLGLESQLKQLEPTPEQASASSSDALNKALGLVNLQEYAQVISPADAAAKRHEIRQAALSGAYGPLTDEDRFQVMGDDIADLKNSSQAAADSLEQINKHLADQNELLKQAAEDAKRRAAVAEAQAPQFLRWLGDAVNSQVGGKLGFGFQTLSFAGGVARP